MREFVDRFDRLPSGVRLFLAAVASALPFYFSAFLSFSVARVANLSGSRGLALHAVVFVTLLTFVVFLSRYFLMIRDQRRDKQEKRIACLLHAYDHVDRRVAKRIKMIHREATFRERLVKLCGASVEDLQDIVEAVYLTFEATFGMSTLVNGRVDFEVTFMTRSYRDGEITIPASFNREGRAPRSMLLRGQNPKIYSNTVTACVYGEPRPTIHIIEDTRGDGTTYEELYPGQTERIRSSIVFPVLSDVNELLGTLVVHCDRPNFFRLEEQKYWINLLEIFSKRLARVRVGQDVLAGMRGSRMNLPLSFFDPGY